MKAALIHDKLYHDGKVPRVICDKIYWRALKRSGVHFSCLFYIGVVFFGFSSYNKGSG